MTPKSRRITQRWKRRMAKHQAIKNNTILAQTLKNTEALCQSNFGLQANPHLSLQANFNRALLHSSHPTLNLPIHLTFHNLCTLNTVPIGTQQLLGLNLKYCIAPNTIPDNINHTVRCMAYSIHTSHFLKSTGSNQDSELFKQIYLKNRNWNPLPASTEKEEYITCFETKLKEAHLTLTKRTQKRNLRNLSFMQLKTLKLLKDNTNLIIKPTDKNLGPAVMDASTYIRKILTNHLLTTDYRQLSPIEAKNTMDNLKNYLKGLITRHQSLLPKPELTFFQCSFQNFHRLPMFYGLPKVHKMPFTLRPIVSSTNGFLAIFSTWLDYKMKKLLPLVKSYIKNSFFSN
jgi:hypothetical protein